MASSSHAQRFAERKQRSGSFYAFHGSSMFNWHSVCTLSKQCTALPCSPDAAHAVVALTCLPGKTMLTCTEPTACLKNPRSWSPMTYRLQILRSSLKNLSGTDMMSTGAAYGAGQPLLSPSFPLPTMCSAFLCCCSD